MRGKCIKYIYKIKKSKRTTRWSLFFRKSWKWWFLSSFDYTFVQENTIKNIFQNAICEVIVFSNKTPIGQSDFTIARCTPSAKVEELWKINRNVYFRIEISGICLYAWFIYLFYFLWRKKFRPVVRNIPEILTFGYSLWIKMIWTCTSILSIAIARD